MNLHDLIPDIFEPEFYPTASRWTEKFRRNTSFDDGQVLDARIMPSGNRLGLWAPVVYRDIPEEEADVEPDWTLGEERIVIFMSEYDERQDSHWTDERFLAETNRNTTASNWWYYIGRSHTIEYAPHQPHATPHRRLIR